MTESEEDDMVDWLMDNPVLYDKQMYGFRFADKKAALWKSKADQTNYTVDELQKWLASQRTVYGKVTKPAASGSEAKTCTHRQEWVFQKFKFMHKHINRMQKTRQLGSIKMKLAKSAAAASARLASPRPTPALPRAPPSSTVSRPQEDSDEEVERINTSKYNVN